MTDNPLKIMNTSFSFDDQSFSINSSSEALPLVRQLLDGHHPGILATVDAFGAPHMRWMATLSLHDFPRVYALTSARSRKVREIECRPSVSWMLFNHDLSLIVSLSGQAMVTRDQQILKQVWMAVDDETRGAFLDTYLSGSAIAVVQTTIDTIECASPRNALNFTLNPQELALHPAPEETLAENFPTP